MSTNDANREAPGRPGASRRFWAVLLLALACALLVWQGRRGGAANRPIRLAGPIFGTTWSLLAPNPVGQDAAELQRLVEDELRWIDDVSNHWREDSQLADFERELGGWLEGDRSRRPPELPLGERRETGLRSLFALADRLVERTDGAFDPTVGPLVAAWGFGPRALDREPEPSELERARERVGWRRLSIFGGARAGFLDAEWRGAPPEFDFSALAKGLAVDVVADALVAADVDDFFLEIGGEVRVRGERLGGGPWRVGVEAPTEGTGDAREAWLAIEPGRAAVATSGDYRAWRESAGGRVAHVIDPRSGRPVSNGVASVTVVNRGPDAEFPCAWADGLATALLVLKLEEGLELVESMPDVEALWILTDEARSRFDTRASSGFEALIAPR